MKILDIDDSKLQKNLILLFAAGLFFWSSLAALLPTLPLYIEEIGANKQQIGIVMGSFALGMFIFRPSMGILADRRGRKLVMLIGMAMGAIAPLGYMVVTSITVLTIIRGFHGISIAAFATAYMALVGDISPPHQRGKIIGYMSLVNPVGVAIGPAIGSFLQTTMGYVPLFLFASTSGILGLLSIFPILNPPLVPKPNDIAEDPFWQILISPRVRVPAIILSLSGLTLGSLHTFIALYIKSTGVDFHPGYFFTAAAMSSFTCRILTGKASDQYGRGLFVTMSLIAYNLAILCIWQANNSMMFLIGALMEGIASGTLIPMISVLMTDRALPHERGRVFSVSLMGFDIGLAIAGPVFGQIAQMSGYRSMFAISLILTIMAMIIFITQSSHNLRDSLRFASGRGIDVYAVK